LSGAPEPVPPPARRLTFRRLVGLDRSGPPPPETLPGQPLRPLTLPNEIGYLRLAGVPVFLVLAYASAHGRSTAAAIVFAAIAWGDYADGIAARVTRQYSRMGALLDPLIDRLLIVSGLVVCWSYDLLPRWALGVLLGREVLMLVLARLAQRRGIFLAINWPGRWGVWFTFSAPFFAIADWDAGAKACLYAGLAFTLVATSMYVRDGLRAAARTPSTSA
jgi:cardiolipin synthase